jgi:hypothetical protein
MTTDEARKFSDQIFYGYFDDDSNVPVYDPPHDAPCPFCGKLVTPDDVRTSALMFAENVYAKRSYFYRIHRSCAERDGTTKGMDGFILDMIRRNGD